MRRKRPQQNRARGVLEIHPLEIALRKEHRPIAAPSERGTAAMQHDGIGDIPAPVAAKPGPVRKVDVFVRRKEILVKPADLLEHALWQQERGATRAEHLS